MNNPTILALDASSTMIGWVLYAGTVLEHGEHRLAGGDIAARCQTAYDILALLLDRFPAVDCIAIESPVARHAKAVIPQARVSGALLLQAVQRWKPILEITPAAAKFALSGRGNASKEAMQFRAHAYGITGEHAADALGIALAAYQQVEVVV